MTVLADYRTDLDNLLATAVDSSTWTTAIKDQSLRMALGELNEQWVYEDDFAVTVTGYEQDLSSVAGVYQVLSAAYPWYEGANFLNCSTAWRRIGHNILYFEYVEPATGEVIRVRYSKLHTITNLDAAVATTVPEAQRGLVGLWAGAHACDLRVRQISENPALPVAAAQHLRAVAMEFRKRASNMLSHTPVGMAVRWGNIGL